MSTVWTSHKRGARSRGEWWSRDGRWRLVEVGNTGSGWTKSVYWRIERWNGNEWAAVPGSGLFTKLTQAKAYVERLIEERYGLAPLRTEVQS